MLERLTKWFSKLSRAPVDYIEVVAEQITTTDATPTTWTAIEIPIDTTSAGSILVRYMFTGRQSDGSQLYSAILESSWSWGAAGTVTRRAAAAGSGTPSANTYGTPRPSVAFDTNNVRPTITGKAATTIVWSCTYRYQYEK
jgi:hypothetical protein